MQAIILRDVREFLYKNAKAKKDSTGESHHIFQPKAKCSIGEMYTTAKKNHFRK